MTTQQSLDRNRIQNATFLWYKKILNPLYEGFLLYDIFL
jgi:hypothetical protein